MFISTALLWAGLLVAESPDTLQTITVVADKGVVVSRTDTIPVNPSRDITEMLLQSPSMFVSDNGGISGLKTVSLRGFGSPHTSIYVDGVRVGNVQSGQTDLGILGLDIFSSAIVDYAQNSLSFITARPVFADGRKVGGRAAFSAASFGTFLPSARIDWKASDRLSVSINAKGTISKGNYKFGSGQERENNDIRQFNGGLDFFGILNGGNWHAKAWYNGSDRGTPGSVSWPSTDRQRDRNAIAQALIRKRFSCLYSLNASAKISYDDIFYTSSWGDSKYGQTEIQLNTSHRFNVSRWLTLSVAADLFRDGLKSTVYNQQRLGTTEAVSAAFHTDVFRADIALQYDGVFDKEALSRNCLSPSMDLRYSILEGLDIEAFARRAYRVPTFNELYYVGYGNPDLKPEDAWLTNLGADWCHRFGNWTVKSKIDGYLYTLSNKITSAPSEADPNIWEPRNIGQVRTSGADAAAGFSFSDKKWTATFDARYSFQDSRDMTPGSESYNQQIAYIARNSLSLNASASISGWSADAAWNLRSGRRDSYGELEDWNTLDLFLRKVFDFGKAGSPAFIVAIKNITDCRYELASRYPMPGFNITGGVEYKF